MEEALYLSRLVPNPRNRQARRDLANCVDMHRTLMRAFASGLEGIASPRAVAGLLYRVETDRFGQVSLLIQSTLQPNWSALPRDWLEPQHPPAMKEISAIVAGITAGQRFRFRLLANPTRKIDTRTRPDGTKSNGRRVELRGVDNWLRWLERKAENHGFRLLRTSAHPVPDVLACRRGKCWGTKQTPAGKPSELTFFGVVFEGALEVSDAEAFKAAIRRGIGPGKAYGFGLLSIAPLTR